MRDQDIGVRARELLAAEFEASGRADIAIDVRRGHAEGHCTPLWMDEALRAIEAALRSTGGEGWQDIATAPKDGTAILVVDMNAPGPAAVIAHWGEHDAWGPDPAWLIGHGEDWPPRHRRVLREMEKAAADLGIMPDPTHWRPLPAPGGARSVFHPTLSDTGGRADDAR